MTIHNWICEVAYIAYQKLLKENIKTFSRTWGKAKKGKIKIKKSFQGEFKPQIFRFSRWYSLPNELQLGMCLAKQAIYQVLGSKENLAFIFVFTAAFYKVIF